MWMGSPKNRCRLRYPRFTVSPGSMPEVPRTEDHERIPDLRAAGMCIQLKGGMIMVTISELEEAFHPDNWLNPRNFDPVLIAEAKKAWEDLAESLERSKKKDKEE